METHEDDTVSYSNLRNPPYEWRVALVAGVLALPGALAGAMLALFVPCPGGAGGGMFLGMLAGAFLGAWMEAKD